MIVTTTSNIEGRRIVKYVGIVSGETVIGTNFFKDFFAGIRDVLGGRAGGYERTLLEGKEKALAEMKERAAEMGANAIVGVDLDYNSIGVEGGGNMLMVSASGTAVVIE
jgi:uncharacterized protein YbjQ (UPF0145 family)